MPLRQAERQSSISEVRATTSIIKTQGLAYFTSLFQNQRVFPGERVKTEAELEVVEGICKWLPEFQRSFDVVPLVLTPAHFHFMGRIDHAEGLIEYHRRRLANNMATLILEEQIVLINFIDRRAHGYHQDLLELADTVSHEGIHFAAPTVVQFVTPDDCKVVRTGFKEGMICDYLNEQTVVELQREFAYRYYPEIPILKKELDRGRNRYEHYGFDYNPRYDEDSNACCEYAGSYVKGAMRQISRKESVPVDEIRQKLGFTYFGGDRFVFEVLLNQIRLHCTQLTINMLTAKDSFNPFQNFV